jgi:putative addiction module component (TIGR02574 family)
MATASADDVLARARALPSRDRARIVRELIETLDDEPADEQAEQLWAVELEKRARDVLAGKNVVVETGELFDRLRNELSSTRGEVFVLAVAHAKQRPRFWLRRVPARGEPRGK